MKSKTILKTGAIICGLTVIIGAFGAHWLKPTLEANGRVSPFETGVLYQMFHGLAILVLGILPLNPHPDEKFGRARGIPNTTVQISKWIKRSYWGFLLGVILFSGSLYGLAIWPQLNWLGPITPIGGVLFILGWVSLAFAISRD